MSGSLERLTRTNLRHEVYARVRAAVLTGELTRDDRITETGLSEMLGVSRAPVREALRQLEQEGLVESLGTRGYRVVETPDVHEVSLLRIALERLAVALVIERGIEEDFRDLRTIVDQMRAAIEAGEPEQARHLDNVFHERLCQASHHDLLVSTWNSIRTQLTIATRAVNRSYSDPSGLPERHMRIVEVLESGDTSRAQEEIERHIRSGLESFLASGD